jgi:class 3 adenylate cyclase
MSPPAVETVTILITDLVDSTALASRVGGVRADDLRREHFGLLRKAIEACQGREVKNTGDGLMVAFASSSAAVGCAVRMQQLMERRNRFADEKLHVRIGIAAGEATVEEGDYFGMPAIEATRLCDKALSDGILASAMARMMAGAREGRSFESVGMLELKGIPEPVEAFAAGWEPLTAQDDFGASVLPTALRSVPAIAYVGRAKERKRLQECAQEARDGHQRVVLLSGDPGIGKTRLATHTALETHSAGFTVCWGTAEEDLGAPYGPWIQALSHYVEHAPIEVLAAHVERHGGEVTRLVRGLTKRVAAVPPPQQTDSETERYLLFEAVAGLLDAACDHGPVVLVLDDLHWADPQTLSLLKHVAMAPVHPALLVLGIYRESDLDRRHPLTDLLADLRRVEGVERLALHGLGVDEVAEMMAAAAGHEIDAVGLQLAQEVTQETDGNPFFVAEVLRHLIESGAIAQGSDGRWVLRSSIADLGLPQSVREVVCRRVERLGEQSQQILTMAAVIGRTFDVELLDLLIDGDEEELLEALDTGVQASLLVESPERVGRFSFAHALIDHALYDALSAMRRARLHRRVAEALEQLCGEEPGERLVAELSEAVGSAGGSAAILAYHWRETGHSDQTVHYLLMAAEQAGNGCAEAEAVTLYNQALGLIPEDDARRRRDVQLKRAIAYARFTHAMTPGDT